MRYAIILCRKFRKREVVYIMKKVLVVDGQGGKIGRGLVAQLVKYPELLEVTAVGTNSMATSNMIKGGAARVAQSGTRRNRAGRA